MKKFNLFAYATLAGLALSFAACTDDDPEISKPGPQIDRGEKCRIESFVLNLPEGETLSGDVYDYDKSIDLAYTTPQLEAMKTSTATVKLSEGNHHARSLRGGRLYAADFIHGDGSRRQDHPHLYNKAR